MRAYIITAVVVIVVLALVYRVPQLKSIVMSA